MDKNDRMDIMVMEEEEKQWMYGLRFQFDWKEVPFTDDSLKVESVFQTLNNTNTGIFYG